MKKALFLSILILLAIGALFADYNQLISQSDADYDNGNYQAILPALTQAESQATTAIQRAEVYWRMARYYLKQGDLAEDRNAPTDERLNFFTQGEQAADRAIQANANSFLGIYWKASNIGRWGQTRGILNSLFKAGPMRDLLIRAVTINPEHSDSYNVLGQLYAAVPGVISFGNVVYAVSYARLAVALQDRQAQPGTTAFSYDKLTKLASHLWARNWDAARRTREQPAMRTSYNRVTTPAERGQYYEGTITIPNLSDRDEARQIINRVISELTAISRRTPGQETDLGKARTLLGTFS